MSHDRAGRDDRRSWLGASAWLLGERSLGLVLGAATWLILARLIGPDEFGVVGYAVSATALALPVGIALHPILTRQFATAGSAHAGDVLRSGMAATAVLVGVVLPVPVAFAVARADEPAVALATLAGAVALAAAPLLVSEPLLLSAGRVQALAVARAAGAIGSAAARVALGALGAGAAALVGVSSLQAILVGIAVFVLARSVRGTDQPRLAPRSPILLLKEGWPLAGAAIAVAVYMSLDQLMLGLMTSDEETGQYAVAVRMVEATYLLPIALAAAASPRIARAKVADPIHYQILLQRLASYSLAGSACVALAVIVAGVPVSRVLLGPGYGDVALLVVLLAPAAIFVALGVAQSPWIANERQTRFQLYRTITGGIVNVVLNLLLIPALGAAGAALATVLAYAVAAVLSNLATSAGRSYLPVQMATVNPWRTWNLVRHDLEARRERKHP